MAIVRFNDSAEFITELMQSKDKIQGRIVRRTTRQTADARVPNIRHMTVVATAVVNDQIIMLEEPCGSLWGIGAKEDLQTKERVEKLHHTIESFCKEYKLECRAGVITNGKEP
jgi:hypothetical protein